MDITLVSKTNFDAANAAIERDIYNIAIGASSKKQCDLSVSGTSFWRMPGDYLKSGSYYWISFTANQSFTADQVALCMSATKSSKVGVIASNVSFVAGKATRILYKAGQSVGRYILMLNNAAKFSAVSLYSTNTNNQISQKLSLIESYVTPQQFGAKGDGVTDDTQAIQKAIDSASAGYGVVLFRAQKYLIKTSASMYSANATSTQKIQWQSDATILKAKSNVMLVSGCHSKILTKGTKQYFCMVGDRGGETINNFTVDGLSFSQQQEQLDGKPYNCALYFGKVNNLKIENCVIEYNGINGVYVNGHNNSHVTVSNNIICFNRVTVTEDGYEDYDSSGINVKSAQYVISNNYIGTKKTQANRMHGGIEAHGVCGNVYANSIQRVASGIYVCNDIRQTYAQNDDNDNCWGKDYSSTSSQQMVWDTDAYLQKSTIIISENRFADVDVVINVWNNVSSSGSSAIRYLPPDVNIDILNNSGIACGTAFAITQDHNVRNVRFSGNHFRCRQMKITSTDISTGDLKRYAAVKCDSNCRIWDVSIDGNFFEGYASIIQWGHDKTGKQQQKITFTNNVMKDCFHYSSTIDVRSMSIYPYFFLFYFNGQGVQAYLDGNEIQIRDKYRVLNSDGTISDAYNDIVPGVLYQYGKAKVVYGQHNRLLNASIMLCRKKLNGFIRQENTGYVSLPGGIQSGTRIVYNYDAQKWFDVGDKLVSVQDHSVKTCTRKGTNKSQTLANGTFMVTKFGFCFSTNDIDKIDIGDHIQIKWNNNADEKYVHQVLFKIGDRFYTSCINESKLRDRYQPGYTAQAEMNFYAPTFQQTSPSIKTLLSGVKTALQSGETQNAINLLDEYLS